MRRSLVILTAAVMLGSSGLAAKPPRPGPLNCPTTGGKSADPFFGITASQNMMPPHKKLRPIAVSGQYKLNMRTGKAILAKAVPQGINPHILLLNLRVIPRGNGGFCVPIRGSFAAGPYTQVTITDRKGNSITVDVQRPQ